MEHVPQDGEGAQSISEDDALMGLLAVCSGIGCVISAMIVALAYLLDLTGRQVDWNVAWIGGPAIGLVAALALFGASVRRLPDGSLVPAEVPRGREAGDQRAS